MNLLFVCTSNRLRSPTAETHFGKQAGYETRSAGTDQEASQQVTQELIDWADIIFVMEAVHRKKLEKRFKGQIDRARLITLGIMDIYDRDQPDLIEILDQRVTPWLDSGLIKER